MSKVSGSMSEKQPLDLKLGSWGEQQLIRFLNNLEENKDDKFQLFKYRYKTYDLRNSKITGEVKTRRVNSYTYDTTIVGFNKVKECIKEYNENGGRLLKIWRFYFIFKDGVYFWDFKKPDEDYIVDIGGRTDRGIDERKDYCYIDCQKLTLLTTQIKSFS
jgi:hypothetical protein